MKSKKRIIIAFVIVVTLIVVGILVFSGNSTHVSSTSTAKTYEDSSGWIWVCSQPIAVKDQGVKYMSGAPSLTPISQADAEKYCHKTGIE
jgi:hypothetical protein